ncbi:MAG: PleD family two-component system response regulator [Anaerolineales bacterium]|nr:PleD family two-component system response regulator [Anaerolineales bacterium]
MQQQAVLVIDDEGPYSRVVAEVLQKKGLRVRTAAHGPSGLFAAKRDQPDLILLDIMMPEMDGLSVVRKIRSEPALSKTPVVVISALAAAEDRQAALEAGADAFLAKPFTMEELTQAIGPFVNVEMAQDTVEPTASPGE